MGQEAARLRGCFVRSERIADTEGASERRLLCAVILRAIADAERGDTAAAAWLEDTGRRWCAVLGVAVDGGDWQTAAAALPEARRIIAAELAQHWQSADFRNTRRAARQNRGVALQDGQGGAQ